MHRTLEKPHMYVDVDDTLVRPGYFESENVYIINGKVWQVNKAAIDLIIQSNAREHVVVVWSQGGADWATTVVKALGLEDLVDIVMAKPSWYMDDRTDVLDPTRHFYKEQWV